MYLESTPYVTLRKANDLINIDYTACDIIGLNDDSSKAAARSYNTIIGVYTRTNDGTKIYLETSGVYSTTTAAKHKPRARDIAIYNGFKVVSDINQDVLHDLYYYAGANETLIIREILEEVQERESIRQELQNQDHNGTTIKHAKYTGRISAASEPKTTSYKNGNVLTKYSYKTNFKYIANILYESNVKAIKTKVQTRTGPALTNKYKNTIVNIRG